MAQDLAHIELSKSQRSLLLRLKNRGPQSVKILSSQLSMTTMGIRQHMADLSDKGLVKETEEERQTRGRPVRYWKLTERGHQQFPNTHAQVTIDLVDVLADSLGETAVNELIDTHHGNIAGKYRQKLNAVGNDLALRVEMLAQLRSQDGFMAEIRLLPHGWLLIENHCPVYTIARSCDRFCYAELDLFQQLFKNEASVERVDHVLAGSRRCAYRIIAST